MGAVLFSDPTSAVVYCVSTWSCQAGLMPSFVRLRVQRVLVRDGSLQPSGDLERVAAAAKRQSDSADNALHG